MIFHSLEHESYETPGLIAAWIDDRSHQLTGTRLYDGEKLPGTDQFDALIVMGGPMSIHDEHSYPWLKAEKQLIAETIRQKKPILGICLGSQFLAQAFGARVYRNGQKEIGLLPVHWSGNATAFLPSLTGSSLVFHWHGETYDLPPGAVHLASSAGCANQAFLVPRLALGLQFHLEVTPAMVREMVEAGEEELVPGPYIQPGDRMLTQAHLLEPCKELLYDLLDRFFHPLTV